MTQSSSQAATDRAMGSRTEIQLQCPRTATSDNLSYVIFCTSFSRGIAGFRLLGTSSAAFPWCRPEHGFQASIANPNLSQPTCKTRFTTVRLADIRRTKFLPDPTVSGRNLRAPNRRRLSRGLRREIPWCLITRRLVLIAWFAITRRIDCRRRGAKRLRIRSLLGIRCLLG
jgi:hypothetical protein